MAVSDMLGMKIDLRWNVDGYFFDDSIKEPSTHWSSWLEIFREARSGNFRRTPELLDIWLATDSHLLRRACALLAGDAGTGEAIHRVVQLSNRGLSVDTVLEDHHGLGLTDACVTDGRLVHIAAVLDALEFNFGSRDFRFATVQMSRVLERDWETIFEPPRREAEFPAYRHLVEETVRSLSQRLGSPMERVHLAEPWHVPNFARLLLRHLGRGYFEGVVQQDLRRHFEASTGIDCRHFFIEGGFQPLAAAATLEAFLDSPDADRYLPGRKYFFGHLVPD
jgi:hypothetical protein